MSYQADLYIMLPCIQKKKVTVENPVSTNAALFIDELSNVTKYEFNNEIVSAYSDNYVSINEIHNIMEQFALSLPLWDIRHFRYFLAQDFANKIEKAFNVPRFIAEYEKNRIFLEQLINVRKLIASEKESKIIQTFATVLAMLQVVPHLFNMVLYIMRGSAISLTQIMSLTISSAVAFLIMWLLFGRKKNGNK